MQPAFLLKDITKITIYAETHIFPKIFRPPTAGLKKQPRRHDRQILGIQKFKERRLFFVGLRPVFVFFVLSDLRVFLEKAEGRRAIRARKRSRGVRMRVGRTRARASVRAPASSPNPQT